MLEAAAQNRHALLVAATGAGKTLAGFLPTLNALVTDPAEGLHTLYISPLKALAVDVRRNLLMPIEEMGLPIRVETRTGDTPSDRKQRQRVKPPHILLTTPESLSLLLSHEDSVFLFSTLQRVIIDEVHAFANGKRGDLLSLSLARLQTLAPQMERVALSATVADPDDYRAWLAPDGDIDLVQLVTGEAAAEPDLQILLPEGRVPWAGHSGQHAIPQLIEEIGRNNITLIFCNTRFLAEYIFQKLWDANDPKYAIGIHHGSLSIEARRKVEGAMAEGRLRALVCTASLDLGVDWGDVDCVIQMGAPKGSSRLLQRIGRSNHRMDEPSKAILVPGNRFEYLEAQAAYDAVHEGVRDGETFQPGSYDVLAQHVMGIACAGPFDEAELLTEVQSALPYSALDAGTFHRVIEFVATGGYALKAYDKFRKLVLRPDGKWHLAHPKFAAQHRFNAGIIVDSPMLDVRFRNGRKLGKVEEGFAATLTPGNRFTFAGMALEVESIKDLDLIVRASTQACQHNPQLYGRADAPDDPSCRPCPANADRPGGLGTLPRRCTRMAGDAGLSQPDAGSRTIAGGDISARQAALYGGLSVRRMERAPVARNVADPPNGKPGPDAHGFCGKRLCAGRLEPEADNDPTPLFSADILADEFIEWVEGSYLLKRAFREVAVISGLVERQHPGKRKTGKQVTFSTDLIYDVLRKYEPDHLLLEAAWADARARLTDVGRLGNLLDRAADTMLHVDLERVSPLAVPLLVMIGRESVAQGSVDDELLLEAESLAGVAMTP